MCTEAFSPTNCRNESPHARRFITAGIHGPVALAASGPKRDLTGGLRSPGRTSEGEGRAMVRGVYFMPWHQATH